jgi:hypothetical protein
MKNPFEDSVLLHSMGEDVFNVEIYLKDLSISNNEVLLSLGYLTGEAENNSSLPDRHFIEMIDTVIAQLEYRCNIQAAYRILDVNQSGKEKNGLSISGKFFKMDKIVTGHLRKSEKAALFVCSIGPGMENWAKELMLSGDSVLSYIINITASVVVEKAADFLHDNIKNRMSGNGLKITNRYSPGYCNWSVSEQHLLFSLLPKNFCGVVLTESALMLPFKSISGVIGIGTSVKWKEYACDKCGIKDCTYRAKRFAKSQPGKQQTK